MIAVTHSLIKKVVPIFFLLGLLPFHFVVGQRILNPSFEGTPAENTPPDNWEPCHELSTPDTQPGFWGVSKPASNGTTYVSLVARGGSVPNPNTTEDIQIHLTEPFLKGRNYVFTIDLAYSNNFHFDSFFYTNPSILSISGASNSCENLDLLWTSDPIDHTEWETYQVEIIPNFDINFLIFRINYMSIPLSGNILMDNINECSIDIEWVSDTTICEHEPLVLDVTIPNGTYLWSDGTTNPTITIREGGTYSVVVSNGCISETFEIVVTTRNCFCDTAIPIQTTPFDSAKCDNVVIDLDAETPGGTYLWSTGSTESVISVSEPGLYTVEISNNCESDVFEYFIETFTCDCTISAPNVFTPNGDRFNEKFEIVGSPDIARYNLKIVNRAGSLVFESSQMENYWDGTLNGNSLPVGVYYYSIDLFCVQGNTIADNSYKGWVTIIR